MKEYFGWVQASDMASVYVHLSGRDVDAALLRLYGATPNEQAPPLPRLQPKTCLRCKELNAPENTQCQRCVMMLDPDEAARLVTRETENRHADEILDRLLDDPDFREVFARKVRELKDAA